LSQTRILDQSSEQYINCVPSQNLHAGLMGPNKAAEVICWSMLEDKCFTKGVAFALSGGCAIFGSLGLEGAGHIGTPCDRRVILQAL
jgi:hypothetical protein